MIQACAHMRTRLSLSAHSVRTVRADPHDINAIRFEWLGFTPPPPGPTMAQVAEGCSCARGGGDWRQSRTSKLPPIPPHRAASSARGPARGQNAPILQNQANEVGTHEACEAEGRRNQMKR